MLHVEREHSVARTNVLRTDVFLFKKERRDGCDECGCEGDWAALQSNGFLYFPYQSTGAKVCFSLTTREGSTMLRRKVIN